MTHEFLNRVATSRVYAAFGALLGLWAEKVRLAEGHPFDPTEVVYRGTLDAAWSGMFGTDPSDNATKAQLRYCISRKTLDLPKEVDKEVHIPHALEPAIFQAVTTLCDSVGVAAKSPLPAQTNWVLRKMPYIRRAHAVKDKFLKEVVEKSLEKLVGKTVDEMEITCGTDEILRREMLLSEKGIGAPLYHSRPMYDEVVRTFHCGVLYLIDPTYRCLVSSSLLMTPPQQP
jgi:hypothetical protein